MTDVSDGLSVTVPAMGLVVLIGVSGSGKSTFARTHFKPTEVLSSDFCRGLVADDENDQSATPDAFDVLHYIDYDDQRRVLERLRDALSPRGLLLLRVGDASAGLPFTISNWVDRTVTFVRGHRLGRLYCRPLLEWRAALAALGFAVRAIPLSQGTPFANVLLEARAR